MKSRLPFPFACLVALLLVLSGCSLTPPLTQEEKDRYLKPPSPYAKATSYSDALEELGAMLEAYGHPSEAYVIQGRQVINKTACTNLPLNITDMIKTAVNKVGGNVLYSTFDPDYIIGEVQTGNPNMSRRLPVVVLEGAITECDENLDTQSQGINADLMIGGGDSEVDLGGGANKDSDHARIALDLHLMDYSTQTLIPRKQSALAVDVWNLSKSYNFGFQVQGSGLGIDGRRKITQGKHDAVRILVELSVLQVLGRLFEVPYWRFIPEAEEDQAVLRMISRNFSQVSGEIQIQTTQALLRRHGYPVEVSGRLDAATRAAIDHYATTTEASLPREIGPELYVHLFVNMPLSQPPLRVIGETPVTPPVADNLTAVPQAQLEADSAPIAVHKAIIYTPNWSTQPVRLRAGEQLQSGARYQFLIMPEENCFLYILQLDTSNQLSMLFPMDSYGGIPVNNHNPVVAGTSYTFPGAEMSFILDQQQGTERIYLLVSDQADPLLENKGREINQAASAETRSRLFAEIIAHLDSKEPVYTTAPGVKFLLADVGEKRLQIDADKLRASRNKVFVFEFEHH